VAWQVVERPTPPRVGDTVIVADELSGGELTVESFANSVRTSWVNFTGQAGGEAVVHNSYPRSIRLSRRPEVVDECLRFVERLPLARLHLRPGGIALPRRVRSPPFNAPPVLTGIGAHHLDPMEISPNALADSAPTSTAGSTHATAGPAPRHIARHPRLVILCPDCRSLPFTIRHGGGPPSPV
jgi:hypothetical protein